ncbi:MAG TPA: hypothetical protein DCZ72_06375 [Armatimonadetes bacterium]|nr:hypothetical protein [Armatimonadota bacterium]
MGVAERTADMAELWMLRGMSPRVRRAFSPEFRDFWLIVGNGVLFRLYFEVFNPKRVIAAFLTELTGQEWVVGLALAAPVLFAAVPTLYYSYRMETAPQRMPYYALGARIKWMSQLALLLSVFLLAGNPLLLALLFVVTYGAFGLGDAMGIPAFGDVVARTILPRRRGRLFGFRVAIGGVLALAIGVLISWALRDPPPLAFPFNYLLLFGIAFVFLVAAQFMFMRVHEPALRHQLEAPPPLRRYLGNAWRMMLADRNARYYILYRNLSPLAWTPAAFLIPYALKELGMSGAVVGYIVTTSVIASSISNLFWGSMGDRRGNHQVIRSSTLWLLVSAIGLALTPLLVGRIGAGWLLGWLLLVNMIGEVSLVGMGNGGINYQYDLAPDDRVPVYVAAINTAAAPVQILAPLAIGAALMVWGYALVFWAGVGFSLVAFLGTLQLGDPRQTALSRRR